MPRINHKASPLFESVKPLTLRSSLKSITFRLWDEELGIPVGYRPLAGIILGYTFLIVVGIAWALMALLMASVKYGHHGPR